MVNSAAYKRDLQDEADSLGWTIETTKGNHLRLVHPKIPGVQVFASSTPGCWESYHKVVGKLRRAMRGAGLLHDNDNDHVENFNTKAGPFGHLPNTTPQERRDRRAEFLSAALESRPPAFAHAGRSGSFANLVELERHLDAA